VKTCSRISFPFTRLSRNCESSIQTLRSPPLRHSHAQNDTGVISFNDHTPSLVKKPATASLDKVVVRAMPLQEHGAVRVLPSEGNVTAIVGAAKASNLHVHNDNDDETSKIVFQEVRITLCLFMPV
jgi:hypothetical protein